MELYLVIYGYANCAKFFFCWIKEVSYDNGLLEILLNLDTRKAIHERDWNACMHASLTGNNKLGDSPTMVNRQLLFTKTT